ncbi:PREDICTED: amyloid beta A4 precursor protein-binding family A member 1 [Galeopterus variegatus]|uniref:Amyloid beta A4 precursor protein-binding family A member 1 n=1 Tax=Galeopterus variegatus TaxID=482537 RepID=A0ABM0QNP2_GALVR|nr:PREDICTED: amyloid beta A4 precursor protein-binding family A member 1 [Galeopterus variegatus]
MKMERKKRGASATARSQAVLSGALCSGERAATSAPGRGRVAPLGLKNQSRVKLNIVRCPPVTTVLIRRPDLRYQLGFSVQNGIICSLMRGGIAERGGVRVGHRIIEITGQSVVATPHEKIVHILSNAVGEIHMKTMPAAMYRLLTAQEQPVYI